MQMQPAKGYRALRTGRCTESGRIYLVTTVTCERQRLFEDWRCAWAAAACLADSATWHDARLLCWVLMPDHWHGLLQLEGSGSLASVMQNAKGRAARAVNLARGRGGTVWMPGFHDHALRHKRDILPSARYMVANPLRAGLVDRLGTYPYWDAVWLDVAKDRSARPDSLIRMTHTGWRTEDVGEFGARRAPLVATEVAPKMTRR
ncbi:REP-associated tyrosine transposase [Xanthomonas cerealis]